LFKKLNKFYFKDKKWFCFYDLSYGK